MEPDEDWEDPPAPEYVNEVEVCRHGIPNGAGCEWCKEDREDW